MAESESSWSKISSPPGRGGRPRAWKLAIRLKPQLSSAPEWLGDLRYHHLKSGSEAQRPSHLRHPRDRRIPFAPREHGPAEPGHGQQRAPASGIVKPVLPRTGKTPGTERQQGEGALPLLCSLGLVPGGQTTDRSQAEPGSCCCCTVHKSRNLPEPQYSHL